jgi:hypothetical protein
MNPELLGNLVDRQSAPHGFQCNFSLEFRLIDISFFGGCRNLMFIGNFIIIFHPNYLSEFWGSL